MKRIQFTWFVLFLVVSCVPKTQYDQTLVSYQDINKNLEAVSKERDQLKTSVSDLERKITELEERNQELSNTNQILLSKNREYAEKSISTQQEVLKLKKEQSNSQDIEDTLSRYEAEFNRLLSNEIQNGHVRVLKSESEVMVAVADDYVFKKNTISIDKTGEAFLKKITPLLKRTRDETIEIESYSGKSSLTKAQKKAFGSHWEMTSLKASKIARELDSLGLKSDKLNATGLGPNLASKIPDKEKTNIGQQEIRIVVSHD